MGLRWGLLAGAVLMIGACADTATTARRGFDAEAHPMFTRAGAHVVARRCGAVPDEIRAELARHDAEIASVLAAEMPPWYMRAADGLLREFEDYPACDDRAMEPVVGYGGLAAREMAADLHKGGNASRELPNAPSRSGGDFDADLHPTFAQAIVSGQWMVVGKGYVAEQRCKRLPDDLHDELARHYGEIRSAMAGAGLPAWYMSEVERLLAIYDKPECGFRHAAGNLEVLHFARLLIEDLHRTGRSRTDRPTGR